MSRYLRNQRVGFQSQFMYDFIPPSQFEVEKQVLETQLSFDLRSMLHSSFLKENLLGNRQNHAVVIASVKKRSNQKI